MSGNKRPVVALVTDAIYPYFHGGKELRYHEVARRLAGRAMVDVYTMQWWDGPRVRTDGEVTYHAISGRSSHVLGNRRSIRQAIFFAFGCLRLLRCRFDVIDADQCPTYKFLFSGS